MKFKKKSSPLKLLSQSQPNFAEMILGWSFFQNCVRHFRTSTKMATKAAKVQSSSKILLYMLKTIIMLINFKFGHTLTLNRAVLAI
jgi:uncharacterized membrane protein YbaN (DUF454 family)